MLIKTSELTGIALDWAVTKAIGEYRPIAVPSYSIDWAIAGPIIEREGITITRTAHGFWEAYKRPANESEAYQCDDLPLVAAMRCYVASKLGDEVDVPEELAGAGAGCV